MMQPDTVLLLAHPHGMIKEFFDGLLGIWGAEFVGGFVGAVFFYWLLKKKLGLIR